MYTAETLRIMAQIWGATIETKYVDLISREPEKVETRTPSEIIDGIKAKCAELKGQ